MCNKTVSDKYTKIISENLNYYMEKTNTTRETLAKAISVNYSTLSNWLLGYNSPKMDKIELIAEYFKINKSDILEKRSNVSFIESINPEDLIKMPVLGSIPAGVPIQAVEDIDTYLYVPKERLKGNPDLYFLLKIKGDSMSPKYQDGDVLLFYVNPSPDSGAEVAVMVNGDDATFKQIIIKENSIVLHPYNPSYEDKVYTDEEINDLPIRVLGEVQSLEYRDLRGVLK